MIQKAEVELSCYRRPRTMRNKHLRPLCITSGKVSAKPGIADKRLKQAFANSREHIEASQLVCFCTEWSGRKWWTTTFRHRQQGRCYRVLRDQSFSSTGFRCETFCLLLSTCSQKLENVLICETIQRSGQFGYSWEGRFSVQGSNLAPPPDPRLFGNTLAGSDAPYQKEGQDLDKRNSRQSSAYSAPQERLISTIRNLGSRQASPSRGEKSAHKSRARTRTRTRTRSSKTGGDDTDEYSYEEEEEEGVTEGEVTEGEEPPPVGRSLQCRMPLLEKDISVTMRKRATDGYGLDPVKNRRLTRESSKSGVGGNAAGAEQLWSWVEHAATMSSGGRAFVDGFDFGFRGVLPILKGFSAYNAQHSSSSASLHPTTSGGGQAGKSYGNNNNNTFHSKRSRTVSQPTTSGTGSGSGVLEDVKHSLSKGESVRALEAAFTRACVSMNKKNGSASFPSISGSAKPSQRQLALTSLGPDFASGDVAAVIRRYESHGQPSKAAAWALFSGNVELAIRSLKNNRGALSQKHMSEYI